MGSFSWLKADNLTKIANVYEGGLFKMLIPKEFGGGFIKDQYQGYGDIGLCENGEPMYDMYELLAFWNAESSGIMDKLQWFGDTFPLMKAQDGYTRHNREVGIDIGCYPKDMQQLKYPLKLVSASYRGTYEDCEGISLSDPLQGCGKLLRSRIEKLGDNWRWKI